MSLPLARKKWYRCEEERGSGQEPALQFRSRRHADLTPAKPAVAIASDPIVDCVAQRSWHDDQRIEQRPRKSQLPGDSQRRSRARVGSSIIDQHDALRAA